MKRELASFLYLFLELRYNERDEGEVGGGNGGL